MKTVVLKGEKDWFLKELTRLIRQNAPHREPAIKGAEAIYWWMIRNDGKTPNQKGR